MCDAAGWNCQGQAALFGAIVLDVRAAIAAGILPLRIPAGSSGSYFVLSTQRQVVGVFKPADEEPYGRANPNWKKRLQRLLLPCLFGRAW